MQETKKINIGIVQYPKYLHLGVTCLEEEMLQYLDIFMEFYDIFAWMYEHIKEYDNDIFQHVIPLKEGSILVRKKSIIINPKQKTLVK